MKLLNKLKNLKKKFLVMCISVGVLIQTQIPVFADVNGGLSTAKTNVINQLKPIINGVVVPLLLVVLVGLAIFAIMKAITAYKQRKELELGWPIVIVIGIVLVATFPTWGWQLIA